MNIKFISFFFTFLLLTRRNTQKDLSRKSRCHDLCSDIPIYHSCYVHRKGGKRFLMLQTVSAKRASLPDCYLLFVPLWYSFLHKACLLVWWRAAECCSVVMVLVIRCRTLLEDLWTIWSCCLYVFYYYHILSYSLGSIFYQCIYGFIPVW